MMQSSKSPLGFLAAALILLLPIWSQRLIADTITLNNGISMEGTLISQTAGSVRFEVGKSVKQVRTFKRSEIADLVVVPKDEIALAEIKKLLPTPDLLDSTAYRRMIEGAPSRFLAAFPTSTYKTEVEKIIATLEDERAKVIAGGVKLDGGWVTKEQISSDAYNHGARVALATISGRIAKNEFLDSLREFDALESSYPDSVSYPAAVIVIREALPKHGARLTSQLATSTRNNARRKLDYSRMREVERERAEASYNRELAGFLKSHAAAKKAKKKWRDFHTWDLASIQDAQEEVKLEQARLAKIEVGLLRERAHALRDVAALAAAENFETAATKLAAIDELGDSPFSKEIQERVAAGVKEAQAQAARIKAAEEREAAKIAREEAAAAGAGAGEKESAETKPAKESRPPVIASREPAGDEDELDDGGDSDEQASSGIGFLTLLMVLIPIMGIVTFLSLKSAKNNQIEDFVPDETTDE